MRSDEQMIIPLIEETARCGMMRSRQPRDAVYEGVRGKMVQRVGLDLCEISRMEKLAEDERFLNRFFTPEERAYLAERGRNRAQTLAGLFAAKEALLQGAGTGIAFELREIEHLSMTSCGNAGLFRPDKSRPGPPERIGCF